LINDSLEVCLSHFDIKDFDMEQYVDEVNSLLDIGALTSYIRHSCCFFPDANQGAGHADHTHGNGAEFAQDRLSLPSGPITRLRAKRFKEALNGLIQEKWADSKKTKMGSNNNQGLVHVIKAIEEAN
jgi:hypothetical protein